MTDNPNTVLVAGATGLLGRAIGAQLARDGWAVLGVARGRKYPRSQPDTAFRVQHGDLADPSFAAEVCAGIESVVFCAGSSGVGASLANPVENLTNSVIPWFNVLVNIPSGARIVLISSQLVYGPGRAAPFTETDHTVPQSPYAAHRLLMEQYGRIWAGRSGAHVAVLRAGNVFGQVGDIDQPRTHGVVAQLLADLVRGNAARLYGGGHQVLELLHADDLADAVAMVLRARTPEDGGFSVFNLHAERLTLREVAGALRAGLGRGKIESVPWPEDVHGAAASDIFLDDSAFRACYGWVPTRNVRWHLEALGSTWKSSIASVT